MKIIKNLGNIYKKRNEMKKKEIDKLLTSVKNRPEAWREGQAYFNYAAFISPKATEEARGNPDLDPFHNDENIDAFVEYLKTKK